MRSILLGMMATLMMIASPARAVELFIGIEGPPSGFRQGYTVNFTGGTVDDALLSLFQPYGTLWYDPFIDEITGNEYFLADDCTPGPLCSGGLVQNFVLGAQSLSFSYATPRSFNHCVLGKNPFQDCAAFYDKPQLDLAVSLSGVDTVDFSVSRSDLAAIPEPATWAMMIGGFGLLGIAFRRRNGRAAAALLLS